MKENTWTLSGDGYIAQYMLAGPRVSDFIVRCQKATQLELETALRGIVVPKVREDIDKTSVRVGLISPRGMTWKPCISHANVYVDASDYWKELKKIECEVAACVVVSRRLMTRIRLWSYMAANIYLNGSHIASFNRSVYRPIMHQELEIDLQAGRNILYMDCMTLGARESRVIIGVQFLDHQDEITVELADEEAHQDAFAFDRFIRSIHIEQDKVCFDRTVGELSYRFEQTDRRTGLKRMSNWLALSNRDCLSVPKESALAEIRIGNGTFFLSREVEFYERRKMVFQKGSTDIDQSLREILGRLAETLPDEQGRLPDSAGMADVIARALLGKEHACDRQVISRVLEAIENRYDCAEFELGSLLRYMRIRPITDEALAARAKAVICGFRYWESETGWDAMCFWSENHAISFYACQIMAGEMYPKAVFTSSGLRGEALAQRGRTFAEAWLSDVEAHGFEEFLSATYLNVTLGALLNLVDYAGGDLSVRAGRVIDMLMQQIAIHTFHGSLIAPMGRIYRNVIYPFTEDCQSLICLFDPEAPRAGEAKWLSFLVGSRYRFADDILRRMKEPYNGTHDMGNARITLEKREEYCLTSVASPRKDGYVRWRSCLFDKGADKYTNAFCRSENERFHGTSYFQPGVLGFQQHLWTAALSAEALVFANHPGTPAEKSAMRPGYWHGNYILPAVSQGEHYIASIYVIPPEAPVQFTHAFVPLKCFDSYLRQDHWFFLKKGRGYLALWCSDRLEGSNDKVFGCEYRAMSTDTAYLCLAGTENEYPSLENFAVYAQSLNPVYDRSRHCLMLDGQIIQMWIKCEDPTQTMD